MTTPDDRYFTWLVDQVKLDNPYREMNELLRELYDCEFSWLPTIWGDENRLMDAKELRYEVGINKEFRPVSVLEVLIALSRRMEFIVGGTAPGWAWQFILNLGFERMYDPLSQQKRERIRERLQSLVYRNYQPDGLGGFFPLQRPDDDQTRVEIWYQMAAYIDEVLPD